MRLTITLEYFTSPGEALFLIRPDGEPIAMEYVAGGRWKADLEVPQATKTLDYSFELHRDGQCVRREWKGRIVPVAGITSHVAGTVEAKRNHSGVSASSASGMICTPEVIEIQDRWQDRPEDSPFWSKAFTDVIFKRKASSDKHSGNVSFTVPCAIIRKNETLAMTGSGTLFDNWKKFIPLKMSAAPLWDVTLKVEEPFEYKFVILNQNGEEIWESGPNRRLAEAPTEGNFLEIRNVVPKFETRLCASTGSAGGAWRGAGTAIPVFSLRSESSFGVGEFKDLKKLVDWAAATGQSIIQILPINDTTMTGTWTDSYPYNANSTFALHPQFIHLPDAGVKADRKYKALQKELNALPAVDYERVNGEKLRLLREAFSAGEQEVISSKEYQRFYSANKGWLIPYAAFRVLRDQNGTPEFEKWKTLSEYSETKVKSFCSRHKAETDFYCYLQFCLDAQLKDAVEYAHSKGIAIKGDLPIGISRTSVDAWQYPRLFNLDSQAGAPPDAFSADGQNWGLPTYNWDEMAKDGYAWWKSRLGKMSEYFDAFRIDHILGFFRIWEIPAGVKSGLLGHFNPALPYSADELRGRGFNPDSQLFVPDPHREGWYHPRIAAQNTEDYRTLNGYMKDAYNNLYNDFFYHRHNGFWKDCAMRKLPALLDSTRMLACGEDLGMIPACVPEVMRELRILSLEIQRMPKSPEKTFDAPATYPYLSVCATGTHDTSTLRGWWEEDRQMSERFFHETLHCEGQAPYFCDPWVCERIIRQHLDSPSMLCVLPLQDWISIDGAVRFQGNPEEERINIPANPRHYWRWRMHLSLEDLLAHSDLTRHLRALISDSGRG